MEKSHCCHPIMDNFFITACLKGFTYHGNKVNVQ